MIEPDDALETQLLRPPREPRKCDAVAEHVMKPSDIHRFGGNGQLTVEQPLIMAVARPQHHAMFAECDRLLVAVGRDVADGQDRHFRDYCELAVCAWDSSGMYPKKAVESSRVIAISWL